MHFHSGPLMYFCSGVDNLFLIANMNDDLEGLLKGSALVLEHAEMPR